MSTLRTHKLWWPGKAIFRAMQHGKRNCFVSYHHGRDQQYLEMLQQRLSGTKVCDYSLKKDIGHLKDETIYQKIREKMKNCSVTIVLVGDQSGYRKWLDWEIWASLRAYHHPSGDPLKSFKPHGLVVVFLPVKKHAMPPRLQDNINSGYAVCLRWDQLDSDLDHAVDLAYNNRMYHADRINNSRKRQTRNHYGIFGFRL